MRCPKCETENNAPKVKGAKWKCSSCGAWIPFESSTGARTWPPYTTREWRCVTND